MKREYKIALILFGCSIILRLLFAIPGILNPELLMRPDSATYIAPAQAMLEHGIYGHGTTPTALRVPLYPALLLSWLWLDGGTAGFFSILANILLSSLAVPAIWLACREAGIKEKFALSGIMIYLFTPTPIALAPMFLSDGLFGTVAAFELLFLICFIQRKESRWLFAAAAMGGLGVLTRPLNLLWIVPCLFAAAFFFGKNWKKCLRDCGIALVIFTVVFFPWVLRNHTQDFGWRIDTVSADSLKHNASVVESRVTGIPAQQFRDAYEQHFQTVFASDPELFKSEDSRLTYQEKYLSDILKKHPGTYLKGFFHPVNYVPDVPSFLENLGLSKSGSGTWDVIVNYGLFSGIRHYFGGKYWLPILLLPLCLILAAGYFLAIFGFFSLLRKKNWHLPLLFLPLGIYYMTVTGPVAYPRFSLPILPYLTLLAAMGLQLLWERRKCKETANTFERNI